VAEEGATGGIDDVEEEGATDGINGVEGAEFNLTSIYRLTLVFFYRHC
jgi:hypothetical protein